MVKTSVIRLLRLEFGISTRELAEAVGVSQQFVSDIELGKYIGVYNYKKSAEPMMQKAFEAVIKKRSEQAQRLTEAYEINRHRLLDFTEDGHEL